MTLADELRIQQAKVQTAREVLERERLRLEHLIELAKRATA